MLREIWDGFKGVVSLVGLQAYAPWVAADLPSFHRLTVSRFKHRLHGMYHDSYESLVHGFMDPSVVEEEPEQLIIKGGSDAPGRGPWTLGINLEERVIGYATWGQLTNQRHGGSGDLGVVFLGLPGLILASPLLLAWGALRTALRWVTGMDLHTWFVWMKIRGQIPFEWRGQVRTAFLNQGNGVADAYWLAKQREHDAKRRAELGDDYDDYEGDYEDDEG